MKSILIASILIYSSLASAVAPKKKQASNSYVIEQIYVNAFEMNDAKIYHEGLCREVLHGKPSQTVCVNSFNNKIKCSNVCSDTSVSSNEINSVAHNLHYDEKANANKLDETPVYSGTRAVDAGYFLTLVRAEQVNSVYQCIQTVKRLNIKTFQDYSKLEECLAPKAAKFSGELKAIDAEKDDQKKFNLRREFFKKYSYFSRDFIDTCQESSDYEYDDVYTDVCFKSLEKATLENYEAFRLKDKTCVNVDEIENGTLLSKSERQELADCRSLMSSRPSSFTEDIIRKIRVCFSAAEHCVLKWEAPRAAQNNGSRKGKEKINSAAAERVKDPIVNPK